jgi:TAT (twin-arginine translocation) pathway signal sequence
MRRRDFVKASVALAGAGTLAACMFFAGWRDYMAVAGFQLSALIQGRGGVRNDRH